MTWFGKASYLALYPLMAPILSSVRFVTQGRMDWGRNEIIPALRWQSPWLLRLEREFLEAIEGACVRDLPASVVHGIFAKSDLSVPVQVLDQDRRVGSERPPRPGALGKQPALTWSRSCADRSPRPSGPSPPVDAGWRM